MKVKYFNDNWINHDAITLTIGNFDGLHRGHLKLIEILKTYKDTKHALMTFNPHPKIHFKVKDFKVLQSVENKIKMLEDQDIDYLFLVNFDSDTASLTVDEFINKLKDLKVKRIIVGSDFRFANKASGSVSDLKKHFEVIIADDISSIDNVRISSSYIRELLLDGKIEEANNLLGYRYFIDGFVEHGNKVGRTLGFPTANVKYDNSFLPGNGVYVTRVLILNNWYYGVCNIGNNPTVNYSETKKVEVFLLDFNEVIYEKEVKVEFIKKLRDEIKFDNINLLIEQMNLDVKNTKNYIKNNNLW